MIPNPHPTDDLALRLAAFEKTVETAMAHALTTADKFTHFMTETTRLLSMMTKGLTIVDEKGRTIAFLGRGRDGRGELVLHHPETGESVRIAP